MLLPQDVYCNSNIFEFPSLLTFDNTLYFCSLFGGAEHLPKLAQESPMVRRAGALLLLWLDIERPVALRGFEM